MPAVTRLGLYGGPRAPYAGFVAASTSCALSGTVTTATEADIVSGGRTVILTLSNDTWVATGGAFEAARQAIIDGLDSDGVEATGWNAEVRDKEVVGSVVRTSPTVVTITLIASPDYDITADETITATVPAAALVTSSIDVEAAPTFDVTFVAEVATTPTGGWITRRVRRPREDETEAERRARVQARRVELGIVEEVAALEGLFQDDEGERPTIKARAGPSEAEIQRRTLRVLEAMAETERRRRARAVLLLLLTV